jgi:predicted S18 family serine protease
MFRYLMPILLILILCASAFAATTVVVNGKAVSVPVIETNGKA